MTAFLLRAFTRLLAISSTCSRLRVASRIESRRFKYPPTWFCLNRALVRCALGFRRESRMWCSLLPERDHSWDGVSYHRMSRRMRWLRKKVEKERSPTSFTNSISASMRARVKEFRPGAAVVESIAHALNSSKRLMDSRVLPVCPFFIRLLA
jgi:hypothetical protein